MDDPLDRPPWPESTSSTFARRLAIGVLGGVFAILILMMGLITYRKQQDRNPAWRTADNLRTRIGDAPTELERNTRVTGCKRLRMEGSSTIVRCSLVGATCTRSFLFALNRANTKVTFVHAPEDALVHPCSYPGD